MFFNLLLRVNRLYTSEYALYSTVIYNDNLNFYKIVSSLTVTLHDIVHTDKSLTLVFEYLDRDLKQYMDECGAQLSMNNVKVSNSLYRGHCREPMQYRYSFSLASFLFDNLSL